MVQQVVVALDKMDAADMEAVGRRRGIAAGPVLAMRHHTLGLPAGILGTLGHIEAHTLSFGSLLLGMKVVSRTLRYKRLVTLFSIYCEPNAHPE